MATLTAANSVLTITAAGLFTAPQRIQGYATDDAFASDAVEFVESMMGVDGNLSFGFTPVPTKLNIMLQADSDSVDVFDTIAQSMKTAREVIIIGAQVLLPGTRRRYTFVKGAMTTYTSLPAVKKVLQPLAYSFTFEVVTAANT